MALSSEFLKSPRQLLPIIISKCNFECILSEASNFLRSLKIILLISLVILEIPLHIPEGNSVDSPRCLLRVGNCEPRKNSSAWRSEIELPEFLQNRQARSRSYPNCSQSCLDFNWILITHSCGYIDVSAKCSALLVYVNRKSPQKGDTQLHEKVNDEKIMQL